MSTLDELRNIILPDKTLRQRTNDLEYFSELFNKALEEFYSYRNNNGWLGDIMTYHQAETVERIEIIKIKHC